MLHRVVDSGNYEEFQQDEFVYDHVFVHRTLNRESANCKHIVLVITYQMCKDSMNQINIQWEEIMITTFC